MAKKKKSAGGVLPQQPAKVNMPVEKPKEKFSFSLMEFRVQAIILAIIGFAFYCNTFFNGYAFDDKLVITQNSYVQEGLSGIPKILTGNSFESFAQKQKIGNPLIGGRYRPLSIVTFAIEQQFLGTSDVIDTQNPKNDLKEIQRKEHKLVADMHFRHFINVLLYILSVIVFLYFLREIVFPTKPLIPFIAALIFMIHPIHTEVVANVKSRDEILSLLFICSTLIFSFRYEASRKIKDLIWALSCFFLALLSKEYGVLLIVLLPFSFFIFKKYNLQRIVNSTLFYLIPLFIYFLLRFSSVHPTNAGADEEIMNNPYLFATPIQKIASELVVLIKYLVLLFYPYPLAADYSYNQIPYSDFSNPIAWVSILLYGGLLCLLVYFAIMRNFLAFPIAFFLMFLLLICNIFVNIGAPMGERLIYHSSAAFSIFLGWLFFSGYSNLKQPLVANASLGVILGMLVVMAGFVVVNRNKDWNSDATLFLKDVQTVPNSIIANCNAGAACLDNAELINDEAKKKEWYLRGVPYLDRAIKLHPKYMLAYINRGIIYFKLNEFDKALADCDTVRKYFPIHTALPYLAYSLTDHYFQAGLIAGRAGNAAGAINNFGKGLEATPTDADLWYNLGYAYFSNQQFEEAKRAFGNTLRLKPGHPQAKSMMTTLTAQGK